MVKWGLFLPIDHVKILVKGVAVLFDVFRRVHAKKFEELFPEIFHVVEAHSEGSFIHITICA